MKIAAIVTTELRRFSRERSNIFFALIFPLAIVLLVGLQFGEQPEPEIGVVATDQPLASEVLRRLGENDQIEVVRYDDADTATAAVDDEDIDAAVVIPDDFDRNTNAGDHTEVGFIATSTGVGPQLQAIVSDAVARTLAVPTAVAAATERGADLDEATRVAEANRSISELIETEITTTGDRLFPEDISGYDVGAAGQLVLFMFLTALTGSATLILNRRIGITTRMLSTPTSLGTVIAGEAVARFTIAVGQGVYIMVASAILFDVRWGSLVAAAAILGAFGAVGSAAAMLSGALFTNDEQAGGVTVVVALALAALGGSMLPVELFSDTMLTIARAIPHYWALDAFSDVVRHDASISDIAPQLGALAVFAAAIGTVAVWRLRITLTKA